MTHEEYLILRKAQDANYLLSKKKLAEEYAFSNAKYKVGDVIQDHIGKGKVLSLKWGYKSFVHPEDVECIYVCRELKKDGTPTKKESERFIYTSNLI